MINELTEHALKNGIDIMDDSIPFSGIKGLYSDNIIIMSKNMTESEYVCVLAEEVGHFEKTLGDILSQNNISNIKEEEKARRWASLKLVTMENLIRCFDAGCRNRYEAAEYIGVTEEFLMNSIDFYKKIYGIYTIKENYVIYFEPFGIMKVE